MDILQWLAQNKELIAQNKVVVEMLKDIATSFALLIGGFWAFHKFALKREFASQVEFTTDVRFIGTHEMYWIVSIVAVICNKAGSRIGIDRFDFDIRTLNNKDKLQYGDVSINYQTKFSDKIKEGSWFPRKW